MAGTPLENVLYSLGGMQAVKKTSAGYIARCPSHDDKTPSLSLSEDPATGKVLLFCHAGCSVDAVLAAIGMETRELFADDNPIQEIPMNQPARVVDTYRYENADGEHVFDVKRSEPKSFRPYLPGAATAGIGNAERVPYHLPQLLKAASEGKTIYVVEGEKDVHTLEAVGEVATTNPLGASSWKSDYAKCFVGAKEVVVIADNDTAGRKWAGEVGASLALHDVTYLLRTAPGAAGADVTDHLGSGKALDELVDLVGTVAPDSDNPFTNAILDWAEFFEGEREPQSWLCEPIIAAKRGHALYAAAKGGKSYFTLPMAAHIATGREWLLMPAQEPRNVLYVDYEMSQDDLWERIQEFGFGAGDDLSHLHYCHLPMSEGLDTREGGAFLLAAATELGCELVIIDTVSRALDGEENSADTLRNFYKHCGMRLKDAGIAVLRLDHAGKDAGRGTRGTSAKSDDVDVVQRIRRSGSESIEIFTTHTRMNWVPENISVEVKKDANGIMRHRLIDAGNEGFAPGAAKDGRLLMELGITGKTSRRTARAMLEQQATVVMTDAKLADGLKYLKTLSWADDGDSDDFSD